MLKLILFQICQSMEISINFPLYLNNADSYAVPLYIHHNVILLAMHTSREDCSADLHTICSNLPIITIFLRFIHSLDKYTQGYLSLLYAICQ